MDVCRTTVCSCGLPEHVGWPLPLYKGWSGSVPVLIGRVVNFSSQPLPIVCQIHRWVISSNHFAILLLTLLSYLTNLRGFYKTKFQKSIQVNKKKWGNLHICTFANMIHWVCLDLNNNNLKIDLSCRWFIYFFKCSFVFENMFFSPEENFVQEEKGCKNLWPDAVRSVNQRIVCIRELTVASEDPIKEANKRKKESWGTQT